MKPCSFVCLFFVCVGVLRAGFAATCPTYWPDDDQEAVHDHITVKHVGTTTLAAYIQREFLVRSTRNHEEVRTTQLQFLGWTVRRPTQLHNT